MIQPTLIREERGYLGSFNRKLNPGDTQHFIFSETDEGPFWMNPLEREERRHDKIMEGQFLKRKLSKDELIQRLQAKGVSATGNIKISPNFAELATYLLKNWSQKLYKDGKGNRKGCYRCCGNVDLLMSKIWHSTLSMDGRMKWASCNIIPALSSCWVIVLILRRRNRSFSQKEGFLVP